MKGIRRGASIQFHFCCSSTSSFIFVSLSGRLCRCLKFPCDVFSHSICFARQHTTHYHLVRERKIRSVYCVCGVLFGPPKASADLVNWISEPERRRADQFHFVTAPSTCANYENGRAAHARRHCVALLDIFITFGAPKGRSPAGKQQREREESKSRRIMPTDSTKMMEEKCRKNKTIRSTRKTVQNTKMHCSKRSVCNVRNTCCCNH